MRRIIISALVFIVVFIVAFAMMFPLDEIVKRQLDTQIAANNIPLTYKTVHSGIFSTTITDMRINNIDAGTLTVKYSPLSLLTKSASAELLSPIGSAQVRFKKGTLTANIDADLDLAGKLIGQEILGFANLTAEYDINSKKGSYKLTSGPIETLIPFQGATMPVKFDNISAEGSIEDTNIFVSPFMANGAVSATANGRITLDTRNIMRSVLALNVEATLYGLNGRYNIRGNLMSPQLVMQ